MSTSIIDTPKLAENADLLGVNKYTEALASFIKGTATPITIALQGEWGSGKTSMMNSLYNEICTPNIGFYGVWINTWQYSLLENSQFILLRIIKGITDEIAKIAKNGAWDKVKTTFFSWGKRLLSIGATAMGGEDLKNAVTEMLGKDELAIKELKDILADAIKSTNKKFVFFIDDLDRIEPVVAVQILELFKNIFDIENCIFILAIDYDVVIKGLKPKFGELNEKNEREFRSFFDKIIQLPFTLPVSNYEVNNFIKSTFDEIKYFEVGELDEKNVNTITEITNLSVGKNPRSLKRLINSLSLIKIINKDRKLESYEKILNIALVSIQISYNYIYQLLCSEPDFINWDNTFADKYRFPKIDEITENLLKNTNEFNDKWEQVLYRACLKDIYLKNNAYNISLLLSLMFKILPKGVDLSSTIENLLSLSAITNVEANQDGQKSERKSRVSFDRANLGTEALKTALKKTFQLRSTKASVPGLMCILSVLVKRGGTNVNREEIMQEFVNKQLSADSGRAGNYLSSVSKLITSPHSSHIRQILLFERDAEKEGAAGQKKENYQLDAQYLNLVKEVLEECEFDTKVSL